MKKIVVLAVFLLPWIALPAQNKLQPVPGETFTYNANEELNKLLDRERKGGCSKIILDLFTSNCIVCFRMLPKMQEIQKKYKKSLLVILLGDQDKEIAEVYEKFRIRFSLTLDVLYDSVFFNQYFISSVPRYLWIDEKGILQAMTGPDELTPQNIEFFITGQPMNIPAQESQSAFALSKLLLINGNGGADTSFLFRSILSRWNKSQPNIYPARLSYSQYGNFFQALGISMSDLYRYAYFGWARWTCRDSVYGKLYPLPVFIGNDSLPGSNARFNYSFRKTEADPDSLLLQRALRNDLATYFGYEVMITKRMMPCWKLVASPGAAQRLKSRYKQQKLSGTFSGIDYQHVAVKAIIELLYFMRYDEYPFIDVTGIGFPIDIKMDTVLTDFDSLRKGLQTAGIELVLSEQQMEVILLKKSNAMCSIK